MHLTLHEQERLMIRVTADLVERRLTRDPGLALNYPEVMALFSAYVLEEARHDKKTVAELMDTNLSDVAKQLQDRLTKLGTNVTLPTSPAGNPTLKIMPGVREMIGDVQVEATFKDGTKLVTIPEPLKAEPAMRDYPGKHELLPDHDQHAVVYNTDQQGNPLPVEPLWAKNTADRPVQVGSHFHLADVNEKLRFFVDQGCTQEANVRGKRLHIPAGTSERIDPGVDCPVWVVPIQGAKLVKGLRAGKSASAPAGSPLDPDVSR
ncbi:urease subunit gamma [Streptomyces sp. NPDC003032]